ncbi:MAG TPA: septal ring lytic transglycosylase RlpA family protein [Terracidiphilus sp.]|jgi:rare lipoprotein A
MNLKTPFRVCLLAGVSSVALVFVAVTLSTPAVQADVRLSRPAATAPPGIPADSPTPDFHALRNAAPETAREKRADILHGLASWYGGVFNGRRTASGETFDMNAMTACHSTLPFGSVVRVVNLRNKRSVVVRITDRGDLIGEGRIIDLSYAAAEKLAMTTSGLAHVDLEVISLGGTHARK